MSKRTIAATWSGPPLSQYRAEALTAAREILHFLEAVTHSYSVEEASQRIRTLFETAGNPRASVDFHVRSNWLEEFLERIRLSIELSYQEQPAQRIPILRHFDSLRSTLFKKLNDYSHASFFLA
jgi:hypothetical protein